MLAGADTHIFTTVCKTLFCHCAGRHNLINSAIMFTVYTKDTFSDQLPERLDL